MVHVIDDFLILSHSYQKCKDDLAAFVTMYDQLGVPLAAGKTYGPAAAIQFLGITPDAVHMEARLPEDKLAKGVADEFSRQTEGFATWATSTGRLSEFCMCRHRSR